MSCEFEEEVSLLLDDALSADEAASVREHIAGCESCRLLERDFVHLSGTIRSFDLEPSPEAALDAVLSSRTEGFWKRRVVVPLPVAAAASLALVLLGGWAAYGEILSPNRGGEVAGKLESRPAVPEPAGLDRFDRGQPAMLYKVRLDGR